MSTELPPILDPCCGSRMMYFQKHSPDVLYCDNRTLLTTLCDGRMLEVKPDIVCDFRSLPFPDATFKAVVFDPPHLTSGGENSWIIKKYGKLPARDWKDYLGEGFNECWRVLRPDGTLLFKWSEEQIPLSEILPLLPAEPLYGNLGRNRKQIFLLFSKAPREDILHPAWKQNTTHDENSKDLVIMQVSSTHGLRQSFQQHFRLLRTGALLVLRIDDCPQSAKEITTMTNTEPLLGNRTRGDRNVFLIYNRPSC